MLLFLLISTFFIDFSPKDCTNALLIQLNLTLSQDAKNFAFCGMLKNAKQETITQLLKSNPQRPEFLIPIINTISATFITEEHRQKFNMAKNYIHSKKNTKARQILEDLHNQDSFHIDVIYELLKIYDYFNLTKKVLDFQEKVLNLNPFHFPSRFIISKSLLKNAELQASLTMIQPLEREPSFKKEWIQVYTQAIFQNGEQSRAIELLKTFNGRNLEINLILAKMLINTRKDLNFAEKILDHDCQNTKLSNLDMAECKQLRSQLKIALKSDSIESNSKMR